MLSKRHTCSVSLTDLPSLIDLWNFLLRGYATHWLLSVNKVLYSSKVAKKAVNASFNIKNLYG